MPVLLDCQASDESPVAARVNLDVADALFGDDDVCLVPER